MKQTKAKQILAAALSAAMVLTGIPAVSGVQSVAAASKLDPDSDYKISAPAVEGTKKHTWSCYGSMANEFNAENAKKQTTLYLNEAGDTWIRGQNPNAEAGIYVPATMKVLDTRTTGSGHESYTYTNGKYKDANGKESTECPDGFVLINSSNYTSYRDYYLTSDGINFTKLSDKNSESMMN